MTTYDRVVIEGSLVRHERVSVVATSALSELEQHMVRYEATTFPVLPYGTVMLSYDRNTGSGFLIVEQKPTRHNILVSHARGRHAADAAHNSETINGQRINRFNVQFPYQYFAYRFRMGINGQGQPFNFTLDGHNLYWRRLPYTNESDTFQVAHCPNVNEHGGICWGNTLAFTPNDNLSTRINAMVNNFPHTVFNEDLGHRTPFGQSLIEWEQNSENPLAYMDWPMWERERTFTASEIMDQFINSAALPIAQINPSYIEIPELPQSFTVGRVRTWLRDLPEATRRRAILAITEAAEAEDIAVPSLEEIAARLQEEQDATPA